MWCPLRPLGYGQIYACQVSRQSTSRRGYKRLEDLAKQLEVDLELAVAPTQRTQMSDKERPNSCCDRPNCQSWTVESDTVAVKPHCAYEGTAKDQPKAVDDRGESPRHPGGSRAGKASAAVVNSIAAAVATTVAAPWSTAKSSAQYFQRDGSLVGDKGWGHDVRIGGKIAWHSPEGVRGGRGIGRRSRMEWTDGGFGRGGSSGLPMWQ